MAKKVVNIDLIVDSKGTVKTISTVKNQFDSLGKSVKPVNTGLKRFKSETNNTTNAVINFNRVIQDSPYGIIGVANNIDPLVQSFISLKKETGSATNAFKTLLKSAFTGPAALITVFSLASTAAVFFAMKMRGAGSASKEAEESIKEQIKAVNDLNKAYNKLAGFSLGQEIQQEIDLIDEAINLANERAAAQKELNAINRNRANLAEDYKAEVEAAGSLFKAKQNIKDALKEEIANYDVLIQRLGFEETQLDDLTEKREDAVKKLEAYNNAQSENAQLAKLVQETQAEVNQTLDLYTAKVEGSDTAVVALAASLTSQINKFRELANEGNTEVIPVIVALQKEFDKLQKATEFDVTLLVDSLERVKLAAGQPIQIDLSDFKVDGIDNTIGSIADLQDKIRELKELQLQAFSTEGVEAFQQQINALQNEIDVLTGKIKESELEQFFRNLADRAIDSTSAIVQGGFDIERSLERQIKKIRQRAANEKKYAKSSQEFYNIQINAERQIQAAKDEAEAKRKSRVKDAISATIAQIALEQFKNIIKNVPFPLNIPIAIAGSALIVGLANKLVSGLPGFADGGLITGVGGEREDKILARLSNGEFVVNAASTRQNLPLLKAINEGNTESMVSEVVRESNTQSVAQIGSTQPDLVSAFVEALETADINLTSTLKGRDIELTYDNRKKFKARNTVNI